MVNSTGMFDFGEALRRLKAGQKVTRAGWNGRGMFLFLTEPAELSNRDEETLGLRVAPSICMRTAQGDIAVGWLASQADMLAEDWSLHPPDPG